MRTRGIWISRGRVEKDSRLKHLKWIETCYGLNLGIESFGDASRVAMHRAYP
jgi:hypothetical protein